MRQTGAFDGATMRFRAGGCIPDGRSPGKPEMSQVAEPFSSPRGDSAAVLTASDDEASFSAHQRVSLRIWGANGNKSWSIQSSCAHF